MNLKLKRRRRFGSGVRDVPAQILSENCGNAGKKMIQLNLIEHLINDIVRAANLNFPFLKKITKKKVKLRAESADWLGSTGGMEFHFLVEFFHF